MDTDASDSKKDINKVRCQLKLLIVGYAGTGKTSFVNRWINQMYDDNYKATIGGAFSYKLYRHSKGDFYRIQFWDLAGQDQSLHITKIFAKDAHGFVVLTDATDPTTRDKGIKWKDAVNEVERFSDGEPLPCVLVENKIDLLGEPEKTTSENFAQEHGFIGHFKASVKENIQINEAMDCLIDEIIKRMEDIQTKENKDVFKTERKVVQLDENMHAVHKEKKINNGTFCC